ncbi:MAG: DUF29 domain-containing protein [Rhodovibrio sp.]|nr:DUF29 domain-containing protein [Rhodovibrio sp.]
MTAPKLKTRDGSDLYDRDFYTWTQDQAERLRALAGQDQIDIAHLAEEVADLGRSELSKTVEHLTLVLTHLIKAVASEATEPQRHWRQETKAHQVRARRTFSPGMRQHIDMNELWRDALGIANDGLRDYGEPPVMGEVPCPFALDALLDRAFDIDTAQDRVRRALEQNR